MSTRNHSSALLVTLTLLLTAPALHAQDPGQAGRGTAAELSLQQQIAKLQAQVARLQGGLAADHEGAGAASSTAMASDSGMQGMAGGMGMKKMPGGMGGMGGMAKKKGMGGKKAMTPAASGMAAATPPAAAAPMGMGMAKGEMGRMAMMGRMRGMASTDFLTSLPGFPGVSHIYHIGSTKHFLDHGPHLALSVEQRRELAGIHETDLLKQATLARQVEEVEQELWAMTGSDTPEAAKIEQAVRKIAKLQADQRLAFIASVGAAARVLTEAQRALLVGDPTFASAPSPSPAGSMDMDAGDRQH